MGLSSASDFQNIALLKRLEIFTTLNLFLISILFELIPYAGTFLKLEQKGRTHYSKPNNYFPV